MSDKIIPVVFFNTPEFAEAQLQGNMAVGAEVEEQENKAILGEEGEDAVLEEEEEPVMEPPKRRRRQHRR